jgi:hypothetical protein
MATFSERATLTRNAGFVDRVRQAGVKYAMYVIANEATQSANYVTMAHRFVADPDRLATLFAVVLAQEDDALTGIEADPSADTDAGDTALSYGLEMRAWPVFASDV